MTTADLKRRLDKLMGIEAARKERFLNSVLVGALNHDAEDIVGAGISGTKVLRESGETIEELTMRAGRILGMQVLFAIYRNGLEAC
jgi:hypothetical protein